MLIFNLCSIYLIHELFERFLGCYTDHRTFDAWDVVTFLIYVLIIHSYYKELDALQSLMFVQKIYFRYISMSSYEKHTGQKNNERFEPRNHVISKWDMIVRVSLVLLLTSSTDKDRNPVPGIRNPRREL